MENTRFLKADPRAPRFRPEVFDILHKRNYSFFSEMKKQHPELKKYRNSDIANCIKLFNIRVANEVIGSRNGVRLSDGLGIIVAGACKVAEVYRPDYQKSTEVGVAVPHQNLHSDSYIAQVKYSNVMDKHMFDNNDLWSFIPCRELARGVSGEFKKGNHKNYIVFTTRQHITHLFRKQKIPREDAKAAENRKRRLEEHDEFGF